MDPGDGPSAAADGGYTFIVCVEDERLRSALLALLRPLGRPTLTASVEELEEADLSGWVLVFLQMRAALQPIADTISSIFGRLAETDGGVAQFVVYLTWMELEELAGGLVEYLLDQGPDGCVAIEEWFPWTRRRVPDLGSTAEFAERFAAARTIAPPDCLWNAWS